MKKCNLLTGAILLALSLSACGSSAENDVKRIDKSADSQTASGMTTGNDSQGAGSAATDKADSISAFTADAFVFEAEISGKKVTISVDSDMSAVLAELGDPLQYFEAASCAFEGLDKTYTYSHFIIETYPSKSGDKISAIDLTDDLVSTKEGLSIGSSKETMEKLYGTDHEVNGTEYIYHKGDMSLKIMFTDGKVSYITYASKVLGTVAEN